MARTKQGWISLETDLPTPIADKLRTLAEEEGLKTRAFIRLLLIDAVLREFHGDTVLVASRNAQALPISTWDASRLVAGGAPVPDLEGGDAR